MITKNKLRKHLKERYEKSGKDIYFLTREVAKKLEVSSHAVTHAVLELEAAGTVERFSTSNLIRWRTRFGKKEKQGGKNLISTATKDKLYKHFKEKYEKSGRDFSFLSKQIARELEVSSHTISYPLLDLESDGIVERFGTSNPIRWKTCFGKKEKRKEIVKRN